MSPAAKQSNDKSPQIRSPQIDVPQPPAANPPIETIYTTVESEPDRTDWLTAVSNLRHINRQLVEEIARLEQALAFAKQSLHTHQETNQSHEITILQQQDELRTAHDRLGGLFQQLETSHQIGQRQQTLIETLSHQLEIIQTIVPNLEAEHEDICQKYQQQSQKLTKTEQVAVELHRRLKLQTTEIGQVSNPTPTAPDLAQIIEIPITASIKDRSISPLAPTLDMEIEVAANPTTADLAPLATTIFDTDISTIEIEPAPPLTPIQVSQAEISRWRSSPHTPTKTSPLTTWREEILQDRATANIHQHLYHPKLDSIPDLTPPVTETVDKESTPTGDLTPKSSPNWPAPTVNYRSNPTTLKIDLPKFPKKGVSDSNSNRIDDK